MASTVFHCFAHLPAELRLQIWEAACQPLSTRSNRGLHYVSAEGDLIVAMPHNWSHSPGTSDTSRSAFLIDGGLWRACKESREAIVKHTRFYDWIRAYKEATVIDGLNNRCANLVGEGFTTPAFIETSESEEECCMLVYPFRDIFCMQVDDWKSLQRHVSQSYLDMKFAQSNDRHFSPLSIVANIAVQFDDSWLEDIPNCLLNFQDDNSARGVFGSLLLKYFMDLEGLDALWIIDKEAWWYETSSQDHDTVYRDGEAEYVEVDWSHIVHLRPDQPSASAFMEKIHHFLMDYPGCNNSHYLNDLHPRDIFRLLVRRDHAKKDPFDGLPVPWRTKQGTYGLVMYMDPDDDPDRKDGGSED